MYLPSPIRGKYCYLYLIEDIYSRKAVGWEVYAAESGEKAGTPMKSVTLLSNMYELGIMGADRTVLLNSDREQQIEKRAA